MLLVCKLSTEDCLERGQRRIITERLGDDLPDCWYSLERVPTPEVLSIIQRTTEIRAILPRMTDPLRLGCHNQLYSFEQDILLMGLYDPFWGSKPITSR